MNCHVYKSTRNPDMYIYLASRDDFSVLPEKLREKFGTAQYVLSFDLASRKKLGQEEPQVVLKNLREKGFHLQLPEVIRASLQYPDMH